MRRRTLLLTIPLLGLSGRVEARHLPLRRVGMNRFGGRLHVDVGLQDLFWRRHRKRLRSGFVSKVLIRASVFAAGADEPVANAFRRSEIVYDIWDEVFRVRRQDGFGEVTGSGGHFRDETFEVRSERDAIRLATALIKFPLVDLDRLQTGRRYRVAFRADLNPLSQELVADVRRSLTRPDKNRGRFAGDSFFGSFVSIFVNPRIEDSERQLRFVSQYFRRTRR